MQCDVGALARGLRRDGDEVDSGDEDLGGFGASEWSARTGKRKKKQSDREERMTGDISGDADSDSGDFRNDSGRQERSGNHHSSRPAVYGGGIGRFFGACSGGDGARAVLDHPLPPHT